ncbi:fibronectin type III domain-containing protein [candidate division KSB1 bacterium]|nr:fibronectin type III domain-containing protein [candidate division KSB1 bacterium]
MNPLKYTSVITIFLLAILSSCENNMTNPERLSSIQLEVKFESPTLELHALNKIATITSVSITVTGSGMSQIIQDLSFNSNTGKASGTIEVPKGAGRVFKVEGKDERNVIQFSGSTTKDINSAAETVSIMVSWIVPELISLSIDEVRSTSVGISWNATNAGDFQFYRVLLSTSSALDFSNHKFGGDINNRSDVKWRLTGLTPNTKYYVAVVVVDTENKYSPKADIKNFTTLRQIELAYDDGDPYGGYYWNANCRFSNKMSPSGTCRLIYARYYIRSIAQGGKFKSLITDAADNILGEKDVTATATGWFDVDFSEENIIINEDFFIEMEFDGINKPSLGYDQENNNRGWDYDGQNWKKFEGTYFIHAVVEAEGGLTKLASEPSNSGTKTSSISRLPFGEMKRKKISHR